MVRKHRAVLIEIIFVMKIECLSRYLWNKVFIPISWENEIFDDLKITFFFFLMRIWHLFLYLKKTVFFLTLRISFFFFFNYLEKITFWFLSSCYHEKMYHVIFRQNNELVIVTLNNDLKMRVKKIIIIGPLLASIQGCNCFIFYFLMITDNFNIPSMTNFVFSSSQNNYFMMSGITQAIFKSLDKNIQDSDIR